MSMMDTPEIGALSRFLDVDVIPQFADHLEPGQHRYPGLSHPRHQLFVRNCTGRTGERPDLPMPRFLRWRMPVLGLI